MIIGQGMLAKRFEKYDNDNIVIFASGVSNSRETSKIMFEKERKLLIEIQWNLFLLSNIYLL